MKGVYDVKTIDKKAIENAIEDIIIALGDDPMRDGLIETPARVARMYAEVFEGMCYTNDEIAEKFDKCFEEESSDLVVVQDIPIFSYCEHHLALMYNMKVSVGYLPKGRVIGLSKIARVADMVGKRLQLQERIGTDISDILKKILMTDDIVVVIEGEHSCMTARGIKKPGAKTRTACLSGMFKDNIALRQEVYSIINK